MGLRLIPALVLAALAAAQETPVFRSEVSLVRVDVLVSTPERRPVRGLGAQDFVLYDNRRQQPIRSFAAEEMPLDVLFLIDVSVSMRPHVERIARASRSALRTLVPGDRGAVMVFDRRTRVRLGWTDSLEVLARGLQDVVDEERFDGGTDITRALLDAARYVQSSGRRDARRAIVILTDDQTERGPQRTARVAGARGSRGRVERAHRAGRPRHGPQPAQPWLGRHHFRPALPGPHARPDAAAYAIGGHGRNRPGFRRRQPAGRARLRFAGDARKPAPALLAVFLRACGCARRRAPHHFGGSLGGGRPETPRSAAQVPLAVRGACGLDAAPA
jgi:hypothetical protein